MEVGGTKISALPELASEQVSDMVVLSYLVDTPKKNYKVPYNNIKERLSQDIIDQHYNPESANAQSGIAVAEAIVELDLDNRFDAKADITFVNEVENTINQKLDTKTDKTTTEALQTELESLDARMESAEDTLFAHAEELETKATKDELQETKEEIEESVKEMADELQKEVNERIGSLEVQVQERATKKELEDTKSDFEKNLQDLKQDIIDGVFSEGQVDEETLEQALKDYISREEYSDAINGLRDEDKILHLLHDEVIEKLNEKTDKGDLDNIYVEIDTIKKQKVTLDDFVSSDSKNGVTSEGIYNFVTGQGYITEENAEKFRPLEPISTETVSGDTDKSAYWFVLDKKYFGKGYLTSVRFKTGVQPEREEQYPNIPELGEDYDYDSGFGYSGYVSLVACKVERDSSGKATSFIPLGYSQSYIELVDNGWMIFDFDGVAMSGESDIAFVFCESVYDTGINDPESKLFNVVIKSSAVMGESSSVYTDNGEENFLAYAQVEYNKPLSTTIVEVTDVIDENATDDDTTSVVEINNGVDVVPTEYENSHGLGIPSQFIFKGELLKIEVPTRTEYKDFVIRNQASIVVVGSEGGASNVHTTESHYDEENKMLVFDCDGIQLSENDIIYFYYTDTPGQFVESGAFGYDNMPITGYISEGYKTFKIVAPNGTKLTFKTLDTNHSEFVTEVKYATSPKAVIDYVNFKLTNAGIDTSTSSSVVSGNESVEENDYIFFPPSYNKKGRLLGLKFPLNFNNSYKSNPPTIILLKYNSGETLSQSSNSIDTIPNAISSASKSYVKDDYLCVDFIDVQLSGDNTPFYPCEVSTGSNVSATPIKSNAFSTKGMKVDYPVFSYDNATLSIPEGTVLVYERTNTGGSSSSGGSTNNELLEIGAKVAEHDTRIANLEKGPKFVILNSVDELPDTQESGTVYLVFE